MWVFVLNRPSHHTMHNLKGQQHEQISAIFTTFHSHGWNFHSQLVSESIQRGNFAKYLFLGVWSPGKSYLFLQNIENALLENLICSYGISFSSKILRVLTKFWTRSPVKFHLLFLLYFVLLENWMCSCRILRKLCWKFWCVLVFASLGKFTYVLEPFLVLLKKMVCSYKRIMSSPGKFICVLITSKPPGKFDVF